VLFGDHHEVGLTAEERRGLESCDRVTLEAVEGATRMLITEQPRRICDAVLAAVARAS
jgi:hypothetical protein